jgi:2-alkyl-3-oxoalkanoate reductase
MKMKSVLVTGASGFLGKFIVRELVKQNYQVRALIRNTSNIHNIQHLDIDFYYGDISDSSSIGRSFDGVDYVIHAAADNSQTKKGARNVTVGGTRNVLDLCLQNQIKKLVYISSCSVYDTFECLDGDILDENSPTERFPECRGLYSWSKLEAEKLVLDIMANGKLDIVCLRPGTIYGPGGEVFTPMLGYSFQKQGFLYY